MADSCLLCYITDRSAFEGDESARRVRLLEQIAEAARAGIDYIQLREKDLSSRDLENLARQAVSILNELRAVNREVRAKLLINSRSDVALATGADGVHLRSDDISPGESRAISNQAESHAARNWVVGISCHTPQEVTEAEHHGADFALFGPVFEKRGATPAGLPRLREACTAKIPVLALGGVTLENAHSCLEAGAAGIAGIRLFQQDNVAEIVKKLRNSTR